MAFSHCRDAGLSGPAVLQPHGPHKCEDSPRSHSSVWVTSAHETQGHREGLLSSLPSPTPSAPIVAPRTPTCVQSTPFTYPSVPSNAVPRPCALPAMTGHPCPRQPVSSQQSSICRLPKTALSPPSCQTLGFLAPQGVASDQEQLAAFSDPSPLWVGNRNQGSTCRERVGTTRAEEPPHSCVTWGKTGPRSLMGRRAGWARPPWRRETWTAGWTRAH